MRAFIIALICLLGIASMGVVIGRGSGTPIVPTLLDERDFESSGCSADGFTIEDSSPDCDDTTAPLISLSGSQHARLEQTGGSKEVMSLTSDFTATTHTYAAFCMRPNAFPVNTFSPLVFGFEDATSGTNGYLRVDWSGGTTGVEGTLGCTSDSGTTSWASSPLILNDIYEAFADYDANSDMLIVSVYDGAGLQASMGCSVTGSGPVSDSTNYIFKTEKNSGFDFDEVRISNTSFSKPSGECNL